MLMSALSRVMRYLNACEQHFEQPVEQSYSEGIAPPVFVISSGGKPRLQKKPSR